MGTASDAAIVRNLIKQGLLTLVGAVTEAGKAALTSGVYTTKGSK